MASSNPTSDSTPTPVSRPPPPATTSSPTVPTVSRPPTSHPQLEAQNVVGITTSKRPRRPSNPLPIPMPSKIGPQRTSKVSQKLKILPAPVDQDEESGRDVYSQVTRIKDTTARRDAERLGKAERAHLPRVTAYATANAYKMEPLIKFLKARANTRGTAIKQFDECIYTPYNYNYPQQQQPQQHHDVVEDLIDLRDAGKTGVSSPPTTSTSPVNVEEAPPQEHASNHMADGQDAGRDDQSLRNFVAMQTSSVVSPEVFLFNYGVVVIWGMTVEEEKRFLKEIAKFESEKLSEEDVQVENFNFYVTSSYQPRIYNDFITLKDGRNYMIKLSISHAIAQSVKISLFEDLVDNTIEDTKSIPQDIATTGKVKMSRRDIMKHIGELFILRININLQGSVLDSPELMWAEPQLEPVYQAARSYLEINQRVSLLNQRLDVIGDLLQMLKEQMSHSQGEHLEWIVIVLIAAEILVAVVNVVVDLFAGAD
ncbi:sporulation protein rmd1 [Rhizina undulata]